MARASASLIFALSLGVLLPFAGGCRKNVKTPSEVNPTTNAQAISTLEIRLKELEHRMGLKTSPLTKKEKKAPIGPIKSLTFRIDTLDDRLRIYWADGSSSDLPCTKEQNIWACG